jgi:hypothetical protein
MPCLDRTISNDTARLQPASKPQPGRVAVPFWTTSAARKQLRILAAEEEVTQQTLIAEALNLLFAARGKEPLA